MPPGKAEDGHLLLKKPHRWESSVAAVKLFQSRGRWPCPQAAGSWWAALVAILCHLLRGWRGWLVLGWGAGQGPRGDMEPSPLATSNKMATWAASPQARRRERASCPKEAVTSREGLCQKVKIWLKATCLGACLHRSYGVFFYCFFCVCFRWLFSGLPPHAPGGWACPCPAEGERRPSSAWPPAQASSSPQDFTPSGSIRLKPGMWLRRAWNLKKKKNKQADTNGFVSFWELGWAKAVVSLWGRDLFVVLWSSPQGSPCLTVKMSSWWILVPTYL